MFLPAQEETILWHNTASKAVKILSTKNNRTITQPNTKKDVERLIGLFEKISCELGWLPGSQLRDYQADAVHFAALVGEALAGGMQVVSATSGQSLPYCRVWPELAEPERLDVAHVTIFALRKEYRAKCDLFWPLCVEFWRFCKANNISAMRLEATPATLRLYRRIGWPLRIIGDLRMHWGEPCYLCEMGTAEVADALARKAQRCTSYRQLLTDAYQGISAGPTTPCQ